MKLLSLNVLIDTLSLKCKIVRSNKKMHTLQMEPTTDEKLATLGRLLKFRRKKLGLNQRIASERLGVSQATYSSWETGGAQPSLENLAAIARFLGLTCAALMTELEGGFDENRAEENRRALAQDLLDRLDLDELAEMGVQISRRVAIALGERGGKYRLE
jgi:transcriptional regulator with XRE-family HTH domain